MMIPQSVIRTILIVGLFILSSVAQAVTFGTIAEADWPNKAKKIINDQKGNWLEITINDWHDVVSTAEGPKKYRYTQGYNYQKKEGFVRTYDLNGQLVNETYGPEYDGRMTKEEMEVAYTLFKKHPEVLKSLAGIKETIHLQGGFNYAEDEPNRPCSLGQRCVHVFAHTDTKELVVHAVVRLTDRSIPYPNFNHNKKREKP